MHEIELCRATTDRKIAILAMQLSARLVADERRAQQVYNVGEFIRGVKNMEFPLFI